MSMNSVANTFKSCYNRGWLQFYKKKGEYFPVSFFNYRPTDEKGEYLCNELIQLQFRPTKSTYKGGIDMKPISRMLTLIVCIVVGVVVFALLFNLTKPAQPRIPSPEYSTLAEEYIDAIETFNNTGKVVVPKGSRFSYDGKTIIIKDINSGAYVTCKFVLDGTVPVYFYNHYTSILPVFFSTILGIITTFACYAGINSCYEKRKYTALNRIKSTATYGDDRRISSDCFRCYKKDYCKCISCPYATKCGRCPTSDCIETFEDMLQENITSEDSSSFYCDEYDDVSEEMPERYECDDCEDTIFGETSECEEVSKQQCESDECKDTVEESVEKCDNCDKATSCECLDCKYVYTCDECPSDNCVANFESKLEPDQEKAVEHVHEETESSFKCTPACVNFENCDCLHGCEYAHECRSCPYPGCTYDFENKLLGITISKKSPTDEK